MNNSTSSINRAAPWFKMDGDNTFRLDYDLNENSLVFDVGGYLGLSSEKIWNKFKCNIYIFEPVEKFANEIEEKFKGNNKVHIFHFGLSNKNTSDKISVIDDKSSIYKKGEDFTEIKLVKISDFIKEHKIEKIDLMEINIEGGEYDLINDLIESSNILKVGNIQVQFHNFVENAESRMREIQKNLWNTHYLTFQYKWIWENWKLKAQPENIPEYKKTLNDIYTHLEKVFEDLESSREESIFQTQQLNDSNNNIQSKSEENTMIKNYLLKLEDELYRIKHSKAYGIAKTIIKPLYKIRNFVKNL